MNLTELLMDRLNVDKMQAMSGAGLIFKLAKDKLDHSDFVILSQYIDDFEEIIGNAPKPGGLMGSFGRIAAGIGGENSRIAVVAKLAGGFSKLNLDSKQIMEFVSVIDSYLRTKNDKTVDGILNKISKEIG